MNHFALRDSFILLRVTLTLKSMIIIGYDMCDVSEEV